MNAYVIIQCSSKCGEGIKKREVRCSSPNADCDPGDKPEGVRRCSEGQCESNNWVVGEWTEVGDKKAEIGTSI